MENMMEVPAATSAFQMKVVEPIGGARTNEVPAGTVPMMVTGWMAPSYPLTMYGLHCWRSEFNSKLKATPGPVTLQVEEPLEGPAVRRGVEPPEPKPVASDMVRTNRVDAATGRGKENEPFPSTYAVGGTEMLREEPNKGARRIENGEDPPVHWRERASHSVGALVEKENGQTKGKRPPPATTTTSHPSIK
jgi:hypothetical protein